MKVKDLLSKIDGLKKSGKITDESEVLTFIDEFMELCEYDESTVALTVLSDNKYLKDELAEQINRCQRNYDKLKSRIDDSAFFTDDERNNAKRELESRLAKIEEAKALAKKYDTIWKNALII